MHTPIVVQVEHLYQYNFSRANPRFPFVWASGQFANALVVPLV